MSVSLDETRQLIEKELATGNNALRSGNEGMARVCARRAAGNAISFWLQRNPKNWKRDVMSVLRAVLADKTIPSPVRDACARLTAKINADFQSPFSTNPLEDASIVINHFLQEDNEQ